MHLHIFDEIELPSGEPGLVHPSESAKGYEDKKWQVIGEMTFAVPVDKNNHFFPEYICRTVVYKGKGKYKPGQGLILRPEGKGRLVLETPYGRMVYTQVRVGRYRYVRYVGKYKHEDFSMKFASLCCSDRPPCSGEPDVLDKLYGKNREIIVGDIEDRYIE